MEVEIADAEAKTKKVQQDAGAEIQRLQAELTEKDEDIERLTRCYYTIYEQLKDESHPNAGLPCGETDLMRICCQEMRRVQAKLEKYKGLLLEAADDIESWGAYTDDYYKEKWNLQADIDKYRKAGGK